MSLFRIETVEDKGTGRFGIEIYYPADAERPYVTTAPRYKSAAAAETDTLAIIAAAANNPAPEEPDTAVRIGSSAQKGGPGVSR